MGWADTRKHRGGRAWSKRPLGTLVEEEGPFPTLIDWPHEVVQVPEKEHLRPLL